jgi:hypothetical protein
MPSQRIPCADCEDKKEEIELGGRFKVTGCEPITGESGWCLITYERKAQATVKQRARDKKKRPEGRTRGKAARHSTRTLGQIK